MGLEVRVTQSSRDEAIDAVAYNKTDIVHQAEILIQAKRYSNCVPTNDVRAQAGSVEENGPPPACSSPPRGSAPRPRPSLPAPDPGRHDDRNSGSPATAQRLANRHVGTNRVPGSRGRTRSGWQSRLAAAQPRSP